MLMSIHLRIITPKKVIFDDDVLSVTAPSAAGEITVLPRHANLFSLLKEGVVKIKKKTEPQYLAIGAGYLETDGREINLLVSRAYGQNEVDEQLTKKAIDHARKLVLEAKDEKQRAEAASLLRRSLVDMELIRKHKRRPPLRS